MKTIKQKSTSERISIRFSRWTAIILLIFGSIINVLFFFSWSNNIISETKKFPSNNPSHTSIDYKTTNRNTNKPDFINTLSQPRSIIIPIDSPDVELLDTYVNNTPSRFPFVIVDDTYFYIDTRADAYVLSDVTRQRERQQQLMLVTLGLAAFFCGIVYFVSQSFVRRSVSDLHALGEYVRTLTIDNLDQKPDFSHLPEHDEIRIVSDSLIATQSKLKKEIALVKNFIAHASHEFRTPLMVISSQAELLSAMGDTNNQQETSINKIQDTTQQINNLLQHLLLLSDTQANKEYRTETIQIHETITHICDNIQHKHQNKHIDLEIIYEKNAPDTLQAYPGSLDIIVRNLLDNAYKYSPAQSLIHLTISGDGITISDHGYGLSESDLDNIWQPFWKKDEARSDAQSFGLGLTLVKHVVDLHGRTIKVDSHLDTGTDFIISR